MSEVEVRDSRALLSGQTADVSVALTALQQAGAAQFDPVRLHYLQRLASRVNGQSGPVQRVLEARLAQALLAFQARFEAARGDASGATAQIIRQHPHAAAELQRLLAAGDFKAVAQAIKKLTAPLPSPTLSDLVRQLAQQSTWRADSGFKQGFQTGTGLRQELNATQYFRATWSKLNVDKRVTQALTQAPRNAGPINSHNLVLRSLALMRDISPDYLNQFTSYVDTLLSLELAEKASPIPAKPVPDTDSRPKPKARRVRVR